MMAEVANGPVKPGKKQANPIDYVKNHNQFKYVYQKQIFRAVYLNFYKENRYKKFVYSKYKANAEPGIYAKLPLATIE